MLLKDVVLCWTPTRANPEVFAGWGEVKVTTKPLPHGDYGHMKTHGAILTGWSRASDYERRDKLNRLFSQMVLNDGLDESQVREALSAIDDVSGHSLLLDENWNRHAGDEDIEDYDDD